MEDISNLIFKKLDDAGCKYEVLSNDLVYTMEDVERVLSVPLEARVKTLVVGVNKGPSIEAVLCGIRANMRLDLKSVANQLDISRSKVNIMDPETAESSIKMPRGAIGLIPPFNSPSIILSNSFKTQPFLFFGVGRNDRTLKVTVNDLSRIVNVRFGDIEKL